MPRRSPTRALPCATCRKQAVLRLRRASRERLCLSAAGCLFERRSSASRSLRSASSCARRSASALARSASSRSRSCCSRLRRASSALRRASSSSRLRRSSLWRSASALALRSASSFALRSASSRCENVFRSANRASIEAPSWGLSAEAGGAGGKAGSALAAAIPASIFLRARSSLSRFWRSSFSRLRVSRSASSLARRSGSSIREGSMGGVTSEFARGAVQGGRPYAGAEEARPEAPFRAVHVMNPQV